VSRRARWEAIFAADPDPWGFRSTAYERDKAEDALSMLAPRYRRAVEVGCANGAVTARLAGRCDALLAVDLADAALREARGAVRDPAVRFARAEMPRAWRAVVVPPVDLIVLSEMLYYLAPQEIDALAGHAARDLAPEGQALLVSWLGPTGEALGGEEAAERFLGAFAGRRGAHVETRRRDAYRVDLLTADPPAA
jgi:cyclopropane fatty-acyl-phospholipid synthase-like methyltransferase